jgi:hypothetical protein
MLDSSDVVVAAAVVDVDVDAVVGATVVVVGATVVVVWPEAVHAAASISVTPTPINPFAR